MTATEWTGVNGYTDRNGRTVPRHRRRFHPGEKVRERLQYAQSSALYFTGASLVTGAVLLRLVTAATELVVMILVAITFGIAAVLGLLFTPSGKKVASKTKAKVTRKPVDKTAKPATTQADVDLWKAKKERRDEMAAKVIQKWSEHKQVAAERDAVVATVVTAAATSWLARLRAWMRQRQRNRWYDIGPARAQDLRQYDDRESDAA